MTSGCRETDWVGGFGCRVLSPGPGTVEMSLPAATTPWLPSGQYRAAVMRGAERMIGFGRIVDEVSALVFTATPDGELDWINRWGLDYLGVQSGNSIATRWTDWVHPADVDAVLTGRDDAVASGRPYERAQRLRRHDAEYRWHWVTVRPVLAETGGIESWVGVAVDAHERFAAEQDLARSEERFRRLGELVADVIFDWDIVTNSVWFSSDLASLGSDQMPAWDDAPSMDALLDFVHPDDVDRVRADLEAAVGNDSTALSWTSSCRGIRVDGSVIAVTTRSAIVRDHTGRAVRLIGSVEDRSAHQRVEQQLRRAQHLDSFTELAAGLAHELNNVFAVVTLASEQLMKEFPERSELGELVSMAIGATQRGGAIIEQLNAFAGQQHLVPSRIEVRAVLDSVAAMGRRAYGQHVAFEVHCDADVGTVIADEQRLGSALFSICLNAVDALPEGGQITLRASTTMIAADDDTSGPQDLPPGDYVLIELTDDGAGMTPETLARAVEPMFTTKNRATHAGLGLSAAHGVVTQTGGHMSLTSRDGDGTTVSIHLPRVDPAG